MDTKSSIFWFITPFSPVKDNQRFGGYITPLSIEELCQARNQHEAGITL
jgi:hypothetical protein